MRKLFYILFIFSSITLFSQVLLEQNCNNFTLGNISTTVDYSISGQGGWRPFAPTGTSLSNFQIVDIGGQKGKVFQLIGTPTSTDTRYITNPDLVSFWANRTTGYNIIELEFDLYTGTSTTSDTQVDVAIYDTTGTKLLCGFGYYPIDQSLVGSAYTISTVTGNAINVYVNPPTPITLQTNTWYRFGASFNKTTGQVLFKGIVNGNSFNFTFNGAGVGLNAGEVDFINFPQPNNTSSITNQFDNLVIRATDVSTFLNSTNEQILLDSFLISPNPTNDFVKITNSVNLKIKNIELLDLNGRIIKAEKINELLGTQLNLTSVSIGTYLLKITTENGSFIKKIIKN